VSAARRLAVTVDPERCHGHARCLATAPELFEWDDQGDQARVVAGVDPAEYERQAEAAVANCPEQAIALIVLE
jgi:ferredoxin